MNRHDVLDRPLLILATLFIASVVAILGYTVFVIEEHKADRLRIDLAGRQRFLGAKHLNEILLASQGYPTAYLETRYISLSTLAALDYGGPALLKLGSQEVAMVPPIPRPVAQQHLDEQKRLLLAVFEKSDAYLLQRPPASSSLDELITLNQALEDNAIQLARAMTEYSESRMVSMAKWELAIGLIVIVTSLLLTKKLIRAHRELMMEMGERRRAEAAWRESERFSRGTVDALPLQIAILDARGVVISINKAWREFAHDNPDTFPAALVGVDYVRVCEDVSALVGDEFERLRGGIQEIMRGDSLLAVSEFPCRCASGLRWFRGHATRFTIEDQVRIVVAYEDITDRKRAEEELHESERQRLEALRESDNLKSALLSSVSHELRTPLTAIKASVSTLLDDDHMPPEVKREFFERIQQEIDYLANLVNNLLDMSRIEAGALKPQLEWHPLEDLIEGAIRLLGAPLKRRPLTIALREDAPAVYVDAVQIQQVLVNLLDNAVKYSPAGSRIEIAVIPESEQCTVSITNTGSGIPEDELPRIFDRFHRGRAAVGRAITGTGLGLAICKSIIEQHGGRIWAESVPDRQTTIAFVLPIVQPLSSAAFEQFSRREGMT
ncbi:ATP-binding protein [Candidatus Nitrospira bockiana]